MRNMIVNFFICYMGIIFFIEFVVKGWVGDGVY